MAPARRSERSGPPFRPDIEGLRAVAVLLVFANHLFAEPTGGFVGVDVFFVLSGYLITGVLVADGTRRGRPSLREFYARRVRRIAPAAVLVLMSTNLVASQVFGTLRARQLRVDSLWAAIFGANIHFSDIGTDYFQRGRPPSAVQHFWSLSIEEQFYLVWPLLIILAFVAARRKRLAAPRTVTCAAVVCVAASLAYCIHLTADVPTAAYFSTPARAWELGVGALGFLGRAQTQRLPAAARAVLAWAGLACIAAAALAYDGGTAFPGDAALLPVLGTVAVVIAADPRGGPGRVGLLDNPVSQVIGRLSYSIYVWHLPCIVLADAYFTTHGVGYYAAAGGGPFLLSAASYWLFEEPVRASTWLSERTRERPRRSLRGWVDDNPRPVCGLIGLAFVVALVVAVRLPQPSPAAPSPQAELAAQRAVAGSTTVPSVPSAPLTEVEQALAQPSWTDLTPSLDHLDHAAAPQFVHCLSVDKPSDVPACTYGDPSAAHLAILVGDSIAASWAPGLILALGPGWRVQVVTHAECAMVDQPTANARNLGHFDPGCYAHRDFTLAWVAQQHPSLVVMSDGYEFAATIVRRPVDLLQNRDLWDQGLETEAAKLAATAQVVALQRPHTTPNLQDCGGHGDPTPQRCTGTVTNVDRAMVAGEQAAVEAAGGTYVLTTDWTCADGSCPAVIANHPVMWDGGHLTDVFSEHLAPRIRAALAAAKVPGLGTG